ncbi:cytidine deaminase [Caulobacter segnis]|uniref:Cytidine deaminase n=2 Tax=Caulobacter segnis TaxID=88688 RepID=D5VN64_CAUST|nr:cytidine deaminase [Caulobacter segnis]ADG11937.1 cytidine deaminase [Caulobacter segnis ATCC 21756]AVQ03563.1 cytidine deaminase [Caulobacter segnis]
MSADVSVTFDTLEQDAARALPALLERSYARYSNFTVAAAVIDDEGRAHYGVNVENAAYPSGTCAEQTAIGAMITAGGSRRIAKVLIAAGSDAVVQPCGACRQRIAEFAAKRCEIVSVQGGLPTARTLFWDLLPQAFGPSDLD